MTEYRILVKLMSGQTQTIETVHSESIDDALRRTQELAVMGAVFKDGPNDKDRIWIPPSSVLFWRVTPNSEEEDIEFMRAQLMRAQLELKA